jgi:hypothetical protein
MHLVNMLVVPAVDHLKGGQINYGYWNDGYTRTIDIAEGYRVLTSTSIGKYKTEQTGQGDRTDW